jgi:hypothetical protein
LKFVHEIRNGIYHRGEEDDLKIEIGLLIYYSFLKNRLAVLGTQRHFTVVTGGAAYEPIDFGQQLSKDEKSFRLDHRKYFLSVLDYLMAKWKISERLDEKVIELFSKQLRRMKSGLFFIESNARDLNFYDTLSHYWHLNDQFDKYARRKRKPKNLDSIMLLALYIRENEDELADIDDIRLRQKVGRSRLLKHRLKYKGKYPYWTDLTKIEDRIKSFKGRSEHSIIKSLIEIENKLHNLYLDIGIAAAAIDGYIQEMIDRARGK